MKATIDIPDDLYRQVKSKSALKGMAVREVAVHLFESWISEENASSSLSSTAKVEKKPPSWFGMASKYADQVDQHDMKSIRAGIARGRRKEIRDEDNPS